MALRFTETNKWKDDWFLSLSNDYRIIWIYMIDNCSIAGLWQKGFTAMEYFCNVKIDEKEFWEVFKGRCVEVPNTNLIFLPKFIKVQYPSGLTSNKPIIKGVRNEVERYNLQPLIDQSLIYHYPIIKQPLSNDKTINKDTGNGTGTGNGIIQSIESNPVNTIQAQNSKKEIQELELPLNTGTQIPIPKEKVKKEKVAVGQNGQTVYSQFIAIYDRFIKDRSDGFGPKMNGADGKAAKEIINHLQGVCKDEATLLATWQSLLDRHHLWGSNFYKEQVKLTQINSNLTNLIVNLKNPKPNGTTNGTYKSPSAPVAPKDYKFNEEKF